MRPDVQRVIVVVLDGLRPDAIDQFDLAHTKRLIATGAWSLAATTVAPSVTAAAMTSLMSGVSPARHGIKSDRILIPRHNGGLTPVGDCLAARGYPSSAFLGELAPIFRGLATRVARRLGFAASRFAGKSAMEILAAARGTVRTQRRGLIVMHWPDADHAGHTHGWMSNAYAAACLRLDEALGALIGEMGGDRSTIVVALADHGGGGATPNDHESDHILDRTIPLVVAGDVVARCELIAPRLVDVPATILWALNVDIPATYEGRVLHEAFESVAARAPAIA